jgi:endonuclease YncB( thermonuclease family)
MLGSRTVSTGLVFALLAAGCGGDPLPAAAPPGRSGSPPFVPERDRSALVTAVVDGETLVLQGGERLRLLGLDAPQGTEVCAEEATRRLRPLVGKIVDLDVCDDPPADQTPPPGGVTAFVALHNEGFVNAEQLRAGLAQLRGVGGCGGAGAQAHLEGAQAEAVAGRRGVFGKGSCAPPALYRIRAGAGAHTDKAGRAWSGDQFFNGGFAWTNPVPIAGTDEPALYQAERFDPWPPPELVYEFPVPPGRYRVVLHFAEIWGGTQGRGARVFDVSVEGRLALDNLDIFAEVGGYRALVKQLDAEVGDGRLTIAFHHVVENPKVSAIEVLKLVE